MPPAPRDLDNNLAGDDLDVQDEVQTLAKGTGITIAAHLVGRLVHVLTDVLLARLFGPATFGIYAIGWNLHRVLSIFTNLGVANGVTYFGVQYWKQDSSRLLGLYRAAMLVSPAAGLLAALACWLGADWLALNIFNKPEAVPAIRTAGLVLPFMMVMWVDNSLSRVTRRVQFALIPNEMVTTLGMLGTFLVAYYGLGLGQQSIWLAMFVSYALAMLASLLITFRLFPELKTATPHPLGPSLAGLMAYSLPTLAVMSFGTLGVWMNRLLGGVFLPAGEVGLYQAASQFINLFGILQGSIASVFVPIIASLHQHGQQEKLNELYKVTTKWSVTMNLPILLVTFTLPALVMEVLYGPAYAGGGNLLFVLTLVQALNVITGSSSGLMMMTRNQQALLRFTLTGFALNMLGVLALAPWLGIYGVALGMLLASLVINLGGVLWIRRGLDIWPYDRRFWKPLAAAGAALAVLLLTGWVPGPGWLALLVRAGLAGLAYLAALLALGLDEADRQFLEVFRRRLAREFAEKQEPGGDLG